jgi:23S rRNA (pseudouridine1915-N3)-methyltransferase
MRLRVLAVGKLKDAGLEAACQENVKRSRAFLPIERRALRTNDAVLSEARSSCGRVIVLDERGEQPTSEDFAGWLRTWREQGVRAVAFAIGEAHGFEDRHRKEADRVMGLSRLTLPHRFAQLMLCEQLYRAGTILAGHPYHH